ncbi:MAG: UDP-N-acetylglucosamine--N-acetylmuramyl-(pentapeptide) pyrophosphoryl-undecaprenol N-acetylglucosamine transferase, partial [Mycobacterium leprae]
AQFLYVGTATGREANLVPRAGVPFVTISSGGVINLSAAQKIKGGLKAAKGVLDSLGHIRRFKPDVVVGTGGFVSGPVLLAARLSRRPVVIQEQNAFPGVTNRLAARWARAVFVPYDEARQHFPPGAPLLIVGNPVRPDVAKATREAGRKAFGYGEDDQVLVVMGGSGGARDFNKAVVAAVKLLMPQLPALRVLHVSGERYLQQVEEAYGKMPGSADTDRVTILPYLHNMPEAYAAGDAGVFRSGAITLAEIAVQALPSVLIPSPNVTHNHQEWNARTLEKRGAALVVREAEMTAELLADRLKSVLTDTARAGAMRQALKQVAQPVAGRAIAEAIMEVARRG